MSKFSVALISIVLGACAVAPPKPEPLVVCLSMTCYDETALGAAVWQAKMRSVMAEPK